MAKEIKRRMGSPCESFSVGEFVWEEMKERAWSLREMAVRMGALNEEEVQVNMVVLEMLFFIPEEDGLHLGDVAQALGKAFGTSDEVWINLDRLWREAVPQSRSTIGDGLHVSLSNAARAICGAKSG